MSPQTLPQNNNSKTWFILGREARLSVAEIVAVLNLKKINFKENVPILKIQNNVDPQIIKQLGGTIKIGEEIALGLTITELNQAMEKEILKLSGKANFGISFYGGKKDRQLGINLKTKLKKEGHSVRVVDSQDGVLNAAQIKFNKLVGKGIEFLVENDNGKFNLAKTIAVQDVDDFSARDFGRPTRDDFSGMLPPKLAMMMINLGQAKKNETILDPFCGSGTILSEALLMGYQNLIGSDISPRAIADTQKNIDWMQKKQFNNLTINQSGIKIMVSDVGLLSKKIEKPIDIIITEPFLGKPLRGNETENEIINQAQELKKLYLSAFKEFAKILKPKGKVIFIVPCFKFKDEWITIDVKDEIKKMGFFAENLLPNYESLLYARPTQKVGREIWKFSLS